MFTFRSETLVCALLLGAMAIPAAPAGEVEAVPVYCNKRCKQPCCAPPAPVVTACKDPCDRCNVGPIRRWLRGCFRKPCKPCAPPCPAPCAPVLAVPTPIVAAPIPVPAPAPFPSAPPPASIGGPAAPSPFPPAAPPTPVVPSGNAIRRSDYSTPLPIRADRIASTGGVSTTRAKVDPAVQVTLVSSRREEPHQKTITDDGGRFRANLTAGTWFVYARNEEGRNIYRGKLEVRENGYITVRMP